MYDPKDEVKVQWFWGTKCNYDCAYCPAALHNNKIEIPPAEHFLQAIEYLGRLIRLEGKTPCYDFTGGEPALMPFLVSSLKKGSGGNAPPNSRLVTNGSGSLEWFERVSSYFSYIEISYHPGWANINHIKEVVEYLKKQDDGPDYRIVVNVDNDDDRWMKGVTAYKTFKKLGYKTKLKLLYSNFGKGTQLFPYKTYQLEYYYQTIGKKFNPAPTEHYRPGIVKHRQRHNIKKEDVEKQSFDFKSYNCYAGIEQLVVYEQGDVYRGWCKEGGKLGNVFEQNVVLPSSPVLCSQIHCRNGFDREATKLTAGSI